MSKRPSVIPANEAADQLTAEVLRGLRKSPKQLSPVWFYDEFGSHLFDSICELPEYYVTRTELDIMRSHAAEMANCIGPHAALIEFGSGTSSKTRLLLDKLEEPAGYVPVDIAREHLLDAAATLARDYPALPIYPVCADFTQSFAMPRQLAQARKRVVYFPGSTLGNFEIPEARRLLGRMRQMIGGEGAVLIGIDMQKNPQTLLHAYNDAAGVTAEFNINALRHLNRELGCNFNLGAFEHCAVWVPEQGRIEMRLISMRDQLVELGGEQIPIARAEFVRTECCHKYTLAGFADLAASADLAVTRVWMDAEKKFSVQLLSARVVQ